MSKSTIKTQPVKAKQPALRGFAAMSPQARSKIASMGGKTVSKRPGWMKHLGRIGGSMSRGGQRPSAATKRG